MNIINSLNKKYKQKDSSNNTTKGYEPRRILKERRFNRRR
jgi:hypothetical protein